MQSRNAFRWLIRSNRRVHALLQFSQPLTATQLSHLTGIRRDGCSNILRELASHGLLYCLNPDERRSRLYHPTSRGLRFQSKLCSQQGLPQIKHYFPDIDWGVYGSVCHRHRSAVLKALVIPLQPSAIKRRALAQNPRLKMSANNVRDVIRFFKDSGIVRAVPGKRKNQPRYDLTEIGAVFRVLLQQAEVGA